MSASGPPPVEFYFDFSSPYSYLASTRIEEICARRGRSLEWKPILLGPVLKHHGKAALLLRPAENEYARVDLVRCAAWLEVPFKFPPRFPVNSLGPSRGYPFARDAGAGGAYCRRLFEACWGEGRDIGEPRVLDEVAGEIGLAIDPFRASLSRPEVKEWLRRETDGAISLGIFGAPTFLVGDQMFYGHDRLALLEQELENAATPSVAFNRWFGISRVERERGRAEYELRVTSRMLNRRGAAHGGVVTALLDSALGAAVVSAIAPEEWCATLQLSVQFREPVRPGRVVGRGRMIKRGRHAAFAEGEVLDATGAVLASAHGTWYVWARRPAL